MATDTAGDVYVANYSTNSIQEYGPGGFIKPIGSGFTHPTGVAVDAAGDVFVADTHNGNLYEVEEFQPNSSTPTRIGSTFSFNNPNGVAVDVAGGVFVADTYHNAIKKVMPDNVTIKTIASGLNTPYGVAVDSWGDLFYTDSGSGKLDEIPHGAASSLLLGSTYVGPYGSTGFNQPYAVAVDAAGDVAVTDVNNGLVVKLAPLTTASSSLTGTTSQAFSANLNGLSAGTTYYVRSFATDSGGIGFGADTSFTTVPNAQTVAVVHDSSGTAINLTSNDPSALTQTYAFTQPSHGTVAVSGFAGAPTVVYTPAAGYQGTDSFTLTDSNGTNTSGSATVTLNVAVGTPTANAQTVSTGQDTAVNMTLTGSDDDSPALTEGFAFTQPSHGTVTVSGSAGAATVVYTPAPGYYGADSFTFTDSNGTNTSGSATVKLTINPLVQATVSGTVGATWGTSVAATLQTNAADGLRLLPAGRNTDLPWLGINTLSITLSQAEALSPSDVTVAGINIANYGPVTISGSGTNYTLTLAQPINAADRVTVTIGNAGIATFTRRLDVMPGDVNDDGAVNALDTTVEHNAVLAGTYLLLDDIDGDGTVSLTDYNLVRRYVNTKLPPTTN